MQLSVLVAFALLGSTSAFNLSPKAPVLRAPRSAALVMQAEPEAEAAEPEPAAPEPVAPEPTFTKGISPVLGGGKASGDVETSSLAENGSKAAFAIVFAALIYGGLNEDKVGEIAKSQYTCVEGKIVNGKKTVCADKVQTSAVQSAFPDVA